MALGRLIEGFITILVGVNLIQPIANSAAPEAALGAELAALAGGVDALIARARTLAETDSLRLACSLIELATQAEPDNRAAHAARAEIYERRRSQELSLMARGIYANAARESQGLAEPASDG